jgi:putative hemolysin
LSLDPVPSSDGASAYLWTCLLAAAASFAISAARYGLETVSQTKLLRLFRKPEDAARFTRYFRDLDRTIIATLLLMVFADAVFVVALHSIVRAVLPAGYPNVGLAITVVIAALYLVLVGRILARTLVERDAERILARVFPALHGVSLVLTPFTVPFDAFRNWLLKVLGRNDPEEKVEAFTDDLFATLEEGEREGVVEEEEREIIEKVVEFSDLEVSEVMTQRPDVDWIRSDASVADALRLASERGHARLPVADGDADHIVGIFYVRDVLDRLPDFPRLERELVRTFCRSAHFVPETKDVVELLKEFRKNKIQIAIVTDEYGATAGLVTIEDILESIVGEIHDEHDPAEQDDIVVHGSTALIDGRARIEDVNTILGFDFQGRDEIDTLGGLVFATLGRVPQTGEKMKLEGHDVRVVAADDRRVQKLEIAVPVRGAS